MVDVSQSRGGPTLTITGLGSTEVGSGKGVPFLTLGAGSTLSNPSRKALGKTKGIVNRQKAGEEHPTPD